MSMVAFLLLVGCVGVINGQTSTYFFGEDNTDCVNSAGQLVVMPDTGCRQFLICDFNGLAYGPQDCAQGTLFDQEKQYCEHVALTNCLQSRDLLLGECATAAVFRNCERYTQCVQGVQLERDCGNLTVYSNTLNVCVHPDDLNENEKADCGL